MCLIIALRSNGITKSKASNTQADNGYKKFRCKHKKILLLQINMDSARRIMSIVDGIKRNSEETA